MAIAEYQQRVARFEAEQAGRRALGERIGWTRVGCGLAAGAALVAGWDGQWLPGRAGVLLGGALFATFLALVAWHRRVLRAARHAGALAELNRRGLARVARHWAALPSPAAPERYAGHPLARDLDVFGQASLFQLACTACTPLGRGRLADWLMQPADRVEIAARQQAMRDLASRIDLRQELEARGGEGPFDDPTEFLAWAEDQPWLAGREALVAHARAAPLLLLAAIVLGASERFAGAWWTLVVMSSLAVTAWATRHIHRVFARVSSGQQAFRRYANLLKLVSQATFQAPRLIELQQRLQVEGHDAAEQLAALDRWITLADLRLSPMIYAPIQAATLWDVHVLRAIEGWQRRAGRHARQWLEALAEFEALASLAALAHAEPTWIDATMHDPPELHAQALGHPLLPGGTRVANDVTLGPPGSFLLVTGSNMSGKSTLFRSLGVNVTLAQAGGPVCAAALRMPPLRLGTSMRVQDSLEEATSFFMAELKRLKQVVDEASRGPTTFLYLLDEILHGTNSRERQIAVRTIVTHLLRQRAIGAISTHDLELADAPGLAEAAQAVHFQESFVATPEGRRMHFDYLLRPGRATTTNALALLELVGLPTARETP